MTLGDLIEAVLLGIIEGLTEFIPVSSTGHLILASELFGYDAAQWSMFNVVIQLGAILAVCWIYRARLVSATIGLGREPAATRFAATLLVAFLPAAVVGYAAHDLIKNLLFSPWVVATTLFLGGVAILVVERHLPRLQTATVDEIGYATAFRIGLFQCLSLIPGVSRSGATIIGALLLGTGRVAATEFSFFLAIPTLVAAGAYELFRERALLSMADASWFGVGLVAAFLSAWLCVRWLLRYVSRHDFSAFAWYRIVVGGVVIAAVYWGVR
jgi:undecaprenyl-diphosphatase